MIRQDNWLSTVEKILGVKVLSHSTIGGSSSGQTIKILTDKGPFFLKKAPFRQLQAEHSGLLHIHEKAEIKVPRIYGIEQLGGGADGLLILEFIESANSSFGNVNWDSFLEQLKRLHSVKSELFGWHESNFIGRLDQPNGEYSSWAEFYIEKRLNEQWFKGITEGKIPEELQDQYDHFITYATEGLSILSIQPSLLHGDLWSGNVMFDHQGTAVLIDPAVYFGHGEVDLAMMDLFGGFPPYLTELYLEGDIPPGYEQRKLIYQLYYQLVHVRLLGGSYLNGVKRIITS